MNGKKSVIYVDTHYRRLQSGKITKVNDHLRNRSYYQMFLNGKSFKDVEMWKLEKLKENYGIVDLRYQTIQKLREGLLSDRGHEFRGNEWYINLKSMFKDFMRDIDDPSQLILYNMKENAYYQLSNLSNDKVISLMKDLELIK